MTTPTLIRRSAAVLTSAGVAAALTLLTPLTAHAAVHSQYFAIGNANASYNGPTVGGTCLLTDGDSSTSSSTVNFTHGTKHRSVNLDATFTSSDNPADTARVKGHLDSKLTLQRHHKDLAAFAMKARGAISVNHSVNGSVCQASGTVAGESPQTLFTEHKKGWFYLTHEVTKPNTIVEVELIDVDRNKVVALDVYLGDHSKLTSRAKLKPGHYGIVVAAGVTVGNGIGILAKGTSAAKAKFDTTVSGEFKPLKKH